jgi:hypothetical protein
MEDFLRLRWDGWEDLLNEVVLKLDLTVNNQTWHEFQELNSL